MFQTIVGLRLVGAEFINLVLHLINHLIEDITDTWDKIDMFKERFGEFEAWEVVTIFDFKEAVCDLLVNDFLAEGKIRGRRLLLHQLDRLLIER